MSNLHGLVRVSLKNTVWYVQSSSAEMVLDMTAKLNFRFDSVEDARLNARAVGFRAWGIGELIDHLTENSTV